VALDAITLATLIPGPKFRQWTAELQQLLSTDTVRPVREQLTQIWISEELRGRGYGGGYDAVRRHGRALQTAQRQRQRDGKASTSSSTKMPLTVLFEQHLHDALRFTEYLGKCMDKDLVQYPARSNSAEVAAMRSGRLTVAGFSTGPVGFAVNIACAVPVRCQRRGERPGGLNLIVKKSSPFQKLVMLAEIIVTTVRARIL
jgi:hypothetical protein